MKAWQVREWGPPEAMTLAELPRPTPGPGEILVRVEAAALNFLDTLIIHGRYQVRPPLPFTPGVEIAGEVVEAGAGADIRPGERVCAQIDLGGFAEYALAEAVCALRLPEGTDAAAAVALPVAYGTAHSALGDRARGRAGETVLVHAGAGGVGLASIQIARAWGCRVLATAGGEEKVAICREHGAEQAFDYDAKEDWLTQVRTATEGRGVDVVIDPVGGAVTERSLRCLAWGARLVIVGFAGGGIASIPANRLLLKNAAAMGVYWGEYKRQQPETMRAVLDDLGAMLARGAIKPVIGRRYPLSEAPRALRDLAERRTVGKAVLIPQA
jgi:NADPH:quinone reductase